MDGIGEIRQELNDLHGTGKSWRAVGKMLVKSGGYAYLVAEGKRNPSEEAVWEWIRNYRGQYAGKVSVEVCPTCGDAHTVDDCHGKHGQPVIVADNERVVKDKPKRTPARKRLRREMTAAQAAVWDGLTKAQKDEVLGL